MEDIERVLSLVTKLRKDPSALFIDDDTYKERLIEVLQAMFQHQLKLKKSGNPSQGVTKLATKGFTLDQLWAQLTHHTERVNQLAINSLTSLMASEDFLRALDQVDDMVMTDDEENSRGSAS